MRKAVELTTTTAKHKRSRYNRFYLLERLSTPWTRLKDKEPRKARDECKYRNVVPYFTLGRGYYEQDNKIATDLWPS